MLTPLTPAVSASEREARIMEQVKQDKINFDQKFETKILGLWFCFNVASTPASKWSLMRTWPRLDSHYTLSSLSVHLFFQTSKKKFMTHNNAYSQYFNSNHLFIFIIKFVFARWVDSASLRSWGSFWSVGSIICTRCMEFSVFHLWWSWFVTRVYVLSRSWGSHISSPPQDCLISLRTLVPWPCIVTHTLIVCRWS